MGCDIHAIIERRESFKHAEGEEYMARWRNAGDPSIGRNYELFAVLAGVRNNIGVKPVAEPRGLPGVSGLYDDGTFQGDFALHPCVEFEAYYQSWQADAHSASWLTLAELKAFDATQTVDDPAVITHRDEVGRVFATAGGVSRAGRDITSELERVGQRRVFTWPGEEDGPTAWDRLLDRMERQKQDGDTDDGVRLVFFFDN